MARRRKYSRRKSNDYSRLFFIGCIVLVFVVNVLYQLALGIMRFIDWTTDQLSEWSFWHWMLFAAILSGITYIWLRFKKERRTKATLAEIKLRKQTIKRYDNMQLLKSMDPFDFEEYVAELFKLMGYETTVTRKTGDGDKDIILRKGDHVAIAECKRYNVPKVTRPDVQKFHSAVMDMKATEGFYITTGNFTKPAVEYVSDKPIQLIDGSKLMNLIEEFSDEVT